MRRMDGIVYTRRAAGLRSSEQINNNKIKQRRQFNWRDTTTFVYYLMRQIVALISSALYFLLSSHFGRSRVSCSDELNSERKSVLKRECVTVKRRHWKRKSSDGDEVVNKRNNHRSFGRYNDIGDGDDDKVLFGHSADGITMLTRVCMHSQDRRKCEKEDE